MRIWAPHEGINPRTLAKGDEEVWAPHPIYPHVFVSNLGGVVRRGGPATMHPVSRTGYIRVTITAKIRPYAHQLVLEAFDGLGGGRNATRLSDDKADNRLCNLRWGETRGRLSPEERAHVVELLSSGLSQAEVARRTGLIPSHVGYYAKKAKVSEPSDDGSA
jgi:hypothetical protein